MIDDRMVKISSEEFVASPARYMEEAEDRSVVLTRDGRPSTVLVPTYAYVRLMQRARELAAREVAYIDSVLALLAEEPPVPDTAAAASSDGDTKGTVVELQISADLIEEAEAFGVDIAAAAIAGIEAAVESARGEKGSA